MAQNNSINNRSSTFVVDNNLTVTAGNIEIPVTSTSINGVITTGGTKFIHQYGLRNTFVGLSSGNFTLSGTNTTALGFSALASWDGGTNNTFIGSESGVNFESGSFNTVIGGVSLANSSVGNNNIAIGYNSALVYTGGEEDNIIIGSLGGYGDIGAIRIGTTGTHLTTTISGIDGVNVGSGVVKVVTMNSDQLGTANIVGGTGITITPSSNQILVSSSGTSNFNYTNVNSSPYTVLATDEYLSVDCSGGPITLNFSTTPTLGRTFIVKDRTGSANTNNITLSTTSLVTFDVISSSYIMNTQFAAIEVIGNGTAYELF